MKTNPKSETPRDPPKPFFGLSFLAAICLVVPIPRAPAQDDTVTISAAEFHRVVYGGRLLTEMVHKPEMDAVCQTLLELHRRNPQSDPMALANVLTNALERFRSNAPVYLRSAEARDELLAVYLETFQQIPAHTNFHPATLTLLDAMMGCPGRNPPTNTLSPADLVHAGSQGFIRAEDKLAQRQALVDTCARRAEGNLAFRQAMDAIVVSECDVVFADTVAQLTNGNPALSNNATMQILLALSSTNSDGSLQTSGAQIDTLFTNETQRLRASVAAIHQAHLNIIHAQSNFLAYLADTNLVEVMAAYEQAQKEPHVNLVAASPATVNALSELLKTQSVTRSKYMRALGNAMSSVSLANLSWTMNTKLAAMQPWKEAVQFSKVSKGLAGAGLATTVAQLVMGFALPSPEEIMLQEIGNVKQMIFQLGSDMHGRFDQVDRSLNNIQATLDETLELVNQVEYDVQQVRQGLVNVQLELYRLERKLFTSFLAGQRYDLWQGINAALYWENFNPAPMTFEYYSVDPNYENTFYSYADSAANNAISSPSGFPTSELADDQLAAHFDWELNANLNYTKEALVNRGIFSTSGIGVLANPQDWFVSAYAYLQLALENPLHFRTKGPRLGPIIDQGKQLTNFLGRLTFTGTNINRPLYDALVSNYGTKLTSFVSQVHATEQNYAHLHQDDFAVDAWRNWAAGAPHVQAASATVTPVPLYAQRVVQVAAGYDHTLALKTDGTVIGWGNNSDGKATPPSDLASVLAISAGRNHSLALKADRTVVGWGNNSYQQRTPPGGLQNVIAVAAGFYHSLALKANGTVIGWGLNDYGQATGARSMFPPYTASGTVTLGGQPLSNVVAIAAGTWHSMALKANGTVVAWGNNFENQTNVPVGLNNVTAIAANGFHCLALRSGSVIAWGDNDFGQINVPPLLGVVGIAAGSQFSLALKSDGTIVGWGTNGFGQIPPANATGYKSIAAGGNHSLALTPDGSVVGWGYNGSGQSAVLDGKPPGGAMAIAAGKDFSLALKTDSTVAGWGNNEVNQTNIPSGLSNVVAIAAGGSGIDAWLISDGHGLALRTDGTVVAWGDNGEGQRSVPAGLSNVIAIAAGEQSSFALKSDGTVAAWGQFDYNPIYRPAGLTNGIALAAGLAHCLLLRSDGTILAWGNNEFGQVTGSSSTPAPYYSTGIVVVAGHTLSNVVAVSAGGYAYSDGGGGHNAGHSLALKADGTVVGWGANGYGQATGSPGGATPGIVHVGGQTLTSVVAIAAGAAQSLALKADGTVVEWGFDIGPKPGNVTNVIAIAAGGYYWDLLIGASPYGHNLALKADGTVVAWGHNAGGQRNVPLSLQSPQTSAPPAKPIELVANAASTQFDGLLVSGPISVAGVGSLSGNALAFDGMDDYMVITNFGAAIPTNDITVEFWQRLATTNVNQTSFYLLPNPTGNRFSFSDRADGSVIWDFGDINGNTGRLWSAPSLLVAGAWQHIALVAKGGPTANYMAIYCNGVLKTNRSSADAFAPAAYDLYLGGITGELDEFRVWNVARTQAEIAANMTNRLSGTEPNLVAYWSFDDRPFSATKVAVGTDFSLALRPYGRVAAWGVNDRGQCGVPAGLGGVVDITAGHHHSLALKTDGTVIGWGWNTFGQATVPAGLGIIVAIAAGGAHSLALGSDGLVYAWGCTNGGQTRVPADLDNIVAIAAGGQHSLALKANATVVAWGANTAGQTDVPIGLNSVVAIAAGESHSLALRNTGEVVAWGWNGYGQTDVPAGASSNVVAIAALRNHSLALRADGTAVAWGQNTYGQTNLPPGLNNVVAAAAGGRHNVFLTAPSGATGGGAFRFVLADVPSRVTQQYLFAVYSNSVEELKAAGPLYTKANELSGAKALLQAVLELGMSYTLERDDVLHGFFYGTEALTDRDVASRLFSAEASKLFNTPDTRAMLLEADVSPRFNRFATRLNQSLSNLAATGQPEIPRIVGHTLRLLHLLRDAWASVPPSALEIGQETNTLRLLLYGEPCAHHALQYSDNLSPPAWFTMTATNLHSEECVTVPIPGNPQRYYRAVLPSAP